MHYAKFYLKFLQWCIITIVCTHLQKMVNKQNKCCRRGPIMNANICFAKSVIEAERFFWTSTLRIFNLQALSLRHFFLFLWDIGRLHKKLGPCTEIRTSHKCLYTWRILYFLHLHVLCNCVVLRITISHILLDFLFTKHT